MTKAMRSSAAALLGLIVMGGLLSRSEPVSAAEPPPIGRAPAPMVQVHGDQAAKSVTLGVGKGVVVDLPAEIKDVRWPTQDRQRGRGARARHLIGVAVGQTNVFFFRAEGASRASHPVTRDSTHPGAIKRHLPRRDHVDCMATHHAGLPAGHARREPSISRGLRRQHSRSQRINVRGPRQ